MDMYSALADPTRRNIIELLAAKGSLSVTEITSKFHMTQPAISQHLKVLHDAKLVNMEKHAQQRLYTMNPESMREIEEWIHNMAKLWNKRFDALENVLQEENNKRLKIQKRKEVHNGKSK